jgi:hypothetical protein
MPNVQFQRAEVTAAATKWNLIADCLAGQDAIKAHDLALLEGDDDTRYLPKPNPDDLTERNVTRYEQYIQRAVWYNVTARTHSGLVGQVFQREPVLELPPLLETLRTDCDGAGVGLLSQAKRALGNVLAYGRSGLLTDYPKTDKPATKAELDAGKIRPTVILYDPWSIINWKTVVVGAKRVLALVVLAESHATDKDAFEETVEDQWRVLSLDENGLYRVGLWRKGGESNASVVEAEAFVPLDARGAPLREIPFQFLGAVNNDVEVDEPPIYDLATLNLAHYRNSADYEESCYIVGQPTPVITGLTQAWKDKNFKNGIAFGSRGGIALPEGGDAKLLQAAPNTMPREAMEAKERQMVALGAKLVEQRQVQRTATEAKQEYATEISVIGACAQNVSQAYERALAWAGAFVGTEEPSVLTLSSGFDLDTMTPEEVTAVVAAWQGDAISTTEMRDKLKAGGVATQDDEAYKEEVASKPRSGLGALAARGFAPEQAPNDVVDEEAPEQA